MLTSTSCPQPSPREESLAFDRRECRRTRRLGCISVALQGSRLDPTPLIEHTTQGARVVLRRKARVNQRVDFRLTTHKGEIEGYARVAWTSALSNGHHIAGLEFIDFELSSHHLRSA